jgi:hypothetical protein
VAAYPGQSGQTLSPEPRLQTIQRLFVMSELSSSQWTYSSERKVGKYLIYHVNEGLSIVPAQTLDRLCFIAVGEYVCDQRDALIFGERTIDQAFPGWNAAGRERLVRPTFTWFRS